MKRHFLAMFAFVACAWGALAQGFPTVSTPENTVWYLIQFVNGGNAITAETSGANVTTSAAVGKPSQLWKVTGDNTNGYQLTNKKGYTLHVASAAKNQMVQASATASGVSTFAITANGDNYEIHPKGNTGISMNLWGGPNENRGVGLWDKGDKNNPVKFVDASALEAESKFSLIPYPQELVVTQQGTLHVAALSAITYGSDEMKEHIEAFAEQLNTSSGITLTVKKAGDEASAGEIWFGVDETLPRDGYTLLVKESGVEIKTSSFGGELYALQTLMQLLPREFFSSTLCGTGCSAQWDLPLVSIKDHPQFEHRGFMMDVARHFFDKDEVKKVLDIMAFYKLNRFHWHLTDDQGWRIEIPEYPKLTEVGAIRAGSFTNNGDGQKFFDDTEYGRGMYFTLDDLREIVAYAAERNIDILPEIDLPGHMVAAVASYPEFSCDPTKKYEVRIDGGISHDVLNVGKDEVIDFLECVLGHVAEVFPFPYIHLGGDECPTEQWATNEDCLRRVQQEGLAGVHELQSWLVEKLGTYLKTEYGKDIVVWDEVLANWNTKNTTTPVIMAWNQSGALSERAADLGFNSILCPYSHVYIDFPQVPENEMLIDEPYYGGWGTNTLERVYSLNPVAYLEGQEEFCWGAQANLWAETLNDNEELEYCLLPRILALAEVGWLPVEKKGWLGFYRRLQSHDEILDQLGYTYAKHYIEPKEYTATEQAIMEAEEILAASIRGGVGYPAAENYDALQEVLETAKASALNTDALTEAIAAYKAAPLVQPEAGKTYRILSASTYFKRQYEGSSMYQKGNGVNFHYTPQTEPEELWQFVPSGDGYILTNCYSGQQVSMDTYNAAIKMTDKGTAIRMDKATIAAGGYTYIPGVVTLSAVNGYSATVTGNVKRLSAELSGQVYAKDEAKLCYNGTWRIEEVTDYTAWLQGMVDKCEHILLTAKVGEPGEPTEEALAFLRTEVLAPATTDVNAGDVTEEQYDTHVAKYLQFQQMERTGAGREFDEGYYYYLKNAYTGWGAKYAAYDAGSQMVGPKDKGTSDNFLWRIKYLEDGRVYLINKATGTAAYPSADAADGVIKLGKNYAWTLEYRSIENTTEGTCIIDASGANSWYANPTSWNYLLLKPFWAACAWEFQKSNVAVEDTPEVEPEEPEEPTLVSAGLYPQPQTVVWGEGKAFDNTVAYTLAGAADADVDAVAQIQKYLSTENGTISLTIGERGDAAVAEYESLIPAKSEGYYLKVSKDGVVIAGNDASGTYYGVQTYLQLAAEAEVKEVTITDWPEVAERGLVEGYYGNPYSDADRKSLLEFFGRMKMNIYIYGPKDDPYHRDRWREEYPADMAEMIRGLAETAAKHKVRFVWAMHPGGDIQWNDEDCAASIAKLEEMYALGVRAFSIFFDDITGSEQSKGDKQAEYLNYITENFVNKHDDVAPLIMCPTEYNKGWAGSDYLDVLGNKLAEESHIMWTGNSVVDMIGYDDMNYINGRIKRNAYIWLNYPVNDYCRDHILMGPTKGNDTNIASMLSGFVSNPMEYAEASKVSLYSIADYTWNMDAYDADASWESALKYIMPSHTEAFRLFCENNTDFGDNIHTARRTDESPSFVKVRNEYNSLMAQGNTAAAVAKLREHFVLMAAAATELMESTENRALVAEITPWCKAMEYIALKGQELMNMRDALTAAQPEAFIASYERYQEYSELQDALRSRDFEGSIRTARPGVAVGSYYVQPFLKSTLGNLVAEYKASYDFGLDVFPAQEVENGTYYIMYNGQYLTNLQTSVPTFSATLDDVQPQRQEWSISLDPATNRYKIVSRQDERYLNEKGEFTVSNETNPYEAVWHTYTILRLANGKYCIQNGGSAGDKAWTVSSSRIVKSNEGVEPKYFIFDLVPVSGTVAEAPIVSTRDVYYIMDGDRYLTNTNPGGTGGTPTFKSVATPGDAQEWRITIDGAGKNHYKLASDADGRYINELGVFGTNDYFADWNTFLILTMDGMCAIQTSQSAGTHLWNIKNDRLEVDNELTRQNAYVIKIVAKGEVTDPDPEPGLLKQFTVNGNIDGPNYTALPSKVMPGVAFDVVLRGGPGYAAKGLTVRYGVNPDGAEFDGEGNRQWSEKYIAANGGKATIPAEVVEGNVNLYATFEREAGTEWSLVFSDEFNAESGSQPTTDKWMRCQRYNATWNRWLSDSEEVIYLEDGDLVARAIPNPDKASDPVDMITGGIKSMGKFGFTYGYVEARIYNNLWIGNFPAFWMMPEDQHLGWPDCGEIDIWEVIDTQNKSYHTIHSNWTYDLGNTGNPQSSFNTSCSYDRYHTFGLAWDATSLIWYLDGKEVGRYNKSTNQSHLDQGQWPFDKHFHLILNQSVGNNAWAANADITHTYETRFDWVRVYQKDGMTNTNGVVDAIEIVEQDKHENNAIYTIQGVRLEGPVENLPKGIYIVGGKKVLVK